MGNPSYPRARRLAETVRRVVGDWLEAEQANHPGPLVTVTDVRVTPDLRHARVYYTALGGEAGQPGDDATRQWLAAATGQARSAVARQVRLRYAPTIEFVPDEVPTAGARIDELLRQLGPRDRSQEGPR